MKRLKAINGKSVNADKFAYDGCHKIFLIESEDDLRKIREAGYVEEDIFPISQIERCFENSCPLRFIQRASNYEDIVEQGAKLKDIKWEYEDVKGPEMHDAEFNLYDGDSFSIGVNKTFSIHCTKTDKGFVLDIKGNTKSLVTETLESEK